MIPPSNLMRSTQSTKLSNAEHKQSEVIDTSTLAMTFKIKLEPTAFEDECQILGGTGHIMFNDPCRKWHFNLTIEAHNARLWIHTRSHSTATRPFDIKRDPAELIHFFLFIAFATREQLGFDPTVERILSDEDGIQYRFEVTDTHCQRRWFQTVAILEQRPAVDLHSSAMRVYRVREVDTQGKALANSTDNVLRDFWTFSDARSEKSIQEDILERLNELSGEDYGDNIRDIKDHFMDFICDMVVGRSVAAAPANSTVYQFADRPRPRVPSAAHVLDKPFFLSDSEGSETISSCDEERKDDTPRALRAYSHRRTVHKHFCVDVYQIGDPAEFFFVLSQCIAILKRFRGAGYLHRDISPGNFLVHYLIPRHLPPPEGDFSKKFVVKIADLEHAKPYMKISRRDPTTGTAYYAAVEVQGREHLFNVTTDYFAPSLGALFFAANFYHDVESVLWMAIDYVVHRIPFATVKTVTAAEDTASNDNTVDKVDDSKARALAERLSSYASRIFTTDIRGTPDRTRLIKDVTRHREFFDLLSCAYGRSSVLTRFIPGLMRILLEVYVDLEKEVVPEGTTPTLRFDAKLFVDRIYDAMYQAFGQISHHFQQHSTRLIPTADILAPLKDEKPSKRSRDDLDEELAGLDAEDAPPQKKRFRQSGYVRSH
ncbi:hypothetical protein HDZ31DRAFT_59632 [Schizophyllum fasciatum]